MCASLFLAGVYGCVSLSPTRMYVCMCLTSQLACTCMSLPLELLCMCVSLSLQLVRMCLSISLSSAAAYVSVYLSLFSWCLCVCLSLPRALPRLPTLTSSHSHTCARSQPPSLARALARNLLTPYVRVSHSYSRSLSFLLFPPICYAPMPREKGGGKMQQKVVRSRDVLVHAYRFSAADVVDIP